MIAVTYRIQLIEPALYTALDGDPNSSVSYPFIPGSAVRGMVATRLSPGTSIVDLPTTARTYLFDGTVCFLNAFLADSQGKRRFSAPLSWRKDKLRIGDQGPIEDHACMDPDLTTFDDPQAVSGYADVSDVDVSLASPARQISVHTLRDRNAGRPTDDIGAVFRYDGLAAGQQFAGAVVVPSAAVGDAIAALIPKDECVLGGSATAGYGLVRFSHIEVDEAWQETSNRSRDIRAGDTVVITMLSDTIIRDTDGAPSQDPLPAIGLPLEPVGAFSKITVVGGFNRTWGLPLPQEWGLRAGGVFVYRALVNISRNDIDELIVRGIGERRPEGYGRIAINWQREANLTQHPASTTTIADANATISPHNVRFARDLVVRRYRQALDRELISAVADLVVTNPPPNSQLSRIRLLSRSALREGNMNRIAQLFSEEKIRSADNKWIDDPKALRPNSLRKFQNARIDRMRLSDWLVDIARDQATIWRWIKRPTSISLSNVALQDDLSTEYAVRLIDGVLGKTMAERRKENRS